MLSNLIETRFGWPLHITAATKPNTVANYLAQAGGAEMLRIAAIAGTEAGRLISPVHDAFLLASPLETFTRDVARLREVMRQSGFALTGGILEIDVDVSVYKNSQRYSDPRGVEMWNRVNGLLENAR